MENWTVAEVAQWVTAKGLADCAAQFHQNEVDGEGLMELASARGPELEEQLKELGFTKWGPRRKLAKVIRELGVPAKEDDDEGDDEGTKAPSEEGTVATPSGWSVVSLPPVHTMPSPSPSASATSPGSSLTSLPMEPLSKELQLPIQVRLPPLEPNHVRVHISSGDYRDVQINPEDNTMKAVYDSIQKEFPAAVLTTYCPGMASAAVLRTDERVTEVQLRPCSSVPLILPTEIILTPGELGDHDPILVQLQEVLVHYFQEFRCWKKTDGAYVFKHESQEASRSKLVVLKRVVRHLDGIIKGRKVGFVSAVGKPREGKSTLLTLMGWHFMKAKGSQQTDIFQVSNSTSVACTSGLWVSTTELTQCRLKSNPSQLEPDSVVLLLDAEGLFADEAGKGSDYFVQLFTIVAVLSSSMILNSKISNIVDERFKGFPGQLAAALQSFYEQNSWLRKHKPAVTYLARDWQKPQDLEADQRVWEEATDNVEDPDSDGAVAMNFIRNAFGTVKFCTLGTPVTGEHKTDILKQRLAPGFEKKLKEILEKVIEPYLHPKQFADQHTDSTHSITGGEPLVQLLSSLISVSETSKVDWPSAMRSFNQKASMQGLEKKAQEIGKELEKQFSAFDAKLMSSEQGSSDSDIVNLKRLGEQVGVQVWEKSMQKNCREKQFRVQGSIAQVQAFVSDMDMNRLSIEPVCPQRLLGELRKKYEREFVGVSDPLKSFNVSAETVAEIFAEKIGEEVAPLIDLFGSLLDRLANQVMEMWEGQAPCCETEKDLEKHEHQALERLNELVAPLKQEQHDENPNLIEQPKALTAGMAKKLSGQLAGSVDELKERIQRKAQSIRQMKDEIIQLTVMKAYVDKLGLPSDASGELATLFREASGEVLFCVAATGDNQPGTTLQMHDRQALQIQVMPKMHEPHQPALVRGLAGRPKDIEKMISEHCALVERLLQTEQIARVQEQIHRAFQPLGVVPQPLVQSLASELLVCWAGSKEGAQTIIKELLACDSIDIGDIAFLGALPDVEKALQVDSCKGKLGRVWAERLQEVFMEACSTLKQKAQPDYQLALCSKTEKDLQTLLKNSLGIEKTTIEHLGLFHDSLPQFRTHFASQADMEKVMKASQHIETLGRMIGFRPPSECWASAWEDVALQDETWRSCIIRKEQDIDRIFYGASFEAKVVSHFKNNICLVKGKEVRVFRRFSLVLFCSQHQTIEKEVMRKRLQEVLGEEIGCDAPIFLGESSRIACITVEATPELRQKLYTPVTFSLSAGNGDKVLIILGPPEGEWVWSVKPPTKILHEYTCWCNGKLQEVQDGLEKSVTPSQLPNLRSCVLERVHTAGVEADEKIVTAMVDRLRRICEDRHFEELDAKIQQNASEVFAFISLKYEADQHPVASAKAIDSSLAMEREELIWRCLWPLHENLMDEVRKHAMEQAWLQAVISKTVSTIKPLAELQRRLQKLASQLLEELLSRVRLELVGKLAKVSDLAQFVDASLKHISEGYVPSEALVEVAGLVYRFDGRRHIPDSLLREVKDGASPLLQGTDEEHHTNWSCTPPVWEEHATASASNPPCAMTTPASQQDMKWAVALVQELFKVFACVQECRVPNLVARSLFKRLKRDQVLAHRTKNDDTYFLLKDADAAFKQLLQDDPVGCDVMRQLPCKLRLRSDYSADKGFSVLDRYGANQAFVTHSEEWDGRFCFTLSVWHQKLETLPLQDFEYRRMQLVKGAQSASKDGAFPLSGSESVFFGSFTAPPSEKGGTPIIPKKSLPPPAIPEAGIDLEELKVRFSVLDDTESEYIEGKPWEATAAKQLMSRCGVDDACDQPDRKAQEAVRVLAMTHTRSIIKTGTYIFASSEGAPVQLKPPHLAYLARTGQSLRQRHSHTVVKMTPLDTLSATQQVVCGGEAKALVLNMANRDACGGGYKKGSRAQEEDLFRRTTLSKSLDPRSYGTSAGQVQYPLKEFVPVISRDVTGFRGPESGGWPLLEQPFCFDVISVAAFNGNSGRGGQEEHFKVMKKVGEEYKFTEEGFMKTVLNISMLLEAAALEGYDHLILGALGCGAFRNHPQEVAGIFKELLPLFGGCFKVVEFAILDLKGAKTTNFEVFQKILQPNYPTPATLQPAKSCGLHPGLQQQLCPKLGCCDQWCQKSHLQSSWHPPLCEHGDDCRDDCVEHRKLYRHKIQCLEQNCRIMFGPHDAKYQEHIAQFTHMRVCKDEDCRDPSHLHPPLCSKGMQCDHVGKEHPDRCYYVHRTRLCRYGTRCNKWSCQDHMASFSHPSAQLCTDPVWCEQKENDAHSRAVAHLCKFGMSCRLLKDDTHARRSLHPVQEACKEGLACKAHLRPHFEDHLTMFHHHGAKFLRPMCNKGAKCQQRGGLPTSEAHKRHVMEYAHSMPESALPVCQVYGHNTVRHLMEDGQKSVEVDFKKNAEQMIEKVSKFSAFRGSKPQQKVLDEVTDFLKRNRPVHRLPVITFGKVARSGCLASHHCLRTSSLDGQFAVQLPSVVKPLCEYPDQAQSISEFVEAVSKHFKEKSMLEKASKQQFQQMKAPAIQHFQQMNPPVIQQFQQMKAPVIEEGALGGKTAELHRLASEVARSEGSLGNMPKQTVTKMKADIEAFLAAMHEQQQAVDAAEQKGEEPKIGIGYAQDRFLETNKMNFAILGPHTLRTYGEDPNDEKCEGVHLIFSNAVLYHPDVYLTPMAATFYHSGAGDKFRPWSATGKDNRAKAFDLMLKEKLHPSAHRCFEALAWDFIARAAKIVRKPEDYKHGIPDGCDVNSLYKPLSNVTFEDFMTFWKNANAHYVIECHLPYLTPVTLVEKVVVAERSFNKMSKEDQSRVTEVFPGKIEKTVDDKSADVQYKLASAPLSWPDLPHSFQWTLMAIKSSEVILPECLSESQPSRIFFRASVPDFTLKLSKSRNGITLTDAFTITVKGEQCSASSSEPGVLPHFNKHLRANSHSIMYCLEVNPDGHVTFRHAGASQVLNSQKLGPVKWSGKLKFVSFLAHGFIQFTDVRICAAGSDLYEHEKDVEVVHMPDSVMHEGIKVEKEKDKDADDWTITRAAKWGLKFMFGGQNGSVAKPACSLGLRCPVAYQTKRDCLSEDQKQHLRETRHLCLHGKSCRDRANSESEHAQTWMHLEKEDCSQGDFCKSLHCVQHRLQFHHWGKGDSLLPCRDGSRCINTHPKHRQQYFHEAIEVVFSDEEVFCQPTEGSSASGDFGGGMAKGAAAAAAPAIGAAAAAARQSSHSSHDQVPQPVAPKRLDFSDIQGSVQEDMDDMGDIYNEDAISGMYGDAKLDEYGCPIGDFDLAKDGSLIGYKVLIGVFYHGCLLQDLEALTIPELKKKGLEVFVRKSMDTFTQALRAEKVHVAWIISSETIGSGNKKEFLEEVERFHKAGRGLMVWGDNAPFFAHANLVLERLFDFTLVGNTPGGKDLVKGDPRKPGHFDRSFKICAGIERMNEGVTICYPTKVQPGWKVFGTSSDNHPVLLAKEASSEKRGTPGSGRVIVDNGFTKIFKTQWRSAGTPRYVSNCTAWLVLRERFRFPGWEFQ